ncbi:MAG TPA: glycoside hydrolase family 3 protein, partial [Tenuifilaceae bacterium]|nr:glycoside hydrolase family 3 protein [Tenuifilaceae bacterium]
MYRIRLWPLGIAVIALIFGSCNVEKRSDAEQVAKAMLDRMTLEEKVGQMAQITLDVVGKGDSLFNSYEPFELDTAELREAIVDYHVGSVLNSSNNRARSLAAWNSIVSTIQNVAIAKTRLAIPVLYGIDAVHGANYTAEATLFPQQIGMAATWNDSLVQAIGSITAYETRASGIPWVFSPVLDLGADPRFPRQYEGFGEDPHLCSVLGVALVNGYQGASVSSPLKVAACAKHYLGYSAPSSGKDRTPAQLPNITLKEYHLPPFKAAVEAGVKTFMVNSGVINGLPVHASHYIITELLKEELGFEGVVVSDWNDIENLYRRDRVVATEKEAIGLAVNAGIDMAMIPYRYQDFCNQLVELVREGSVEESRIDDAVMRILKLKAELGLFERPTTVLGDYPKAGSEEFAKVSYQAAGESITLLKNSNGILPLSKDKRYKILVAGPNANSMRTLDGGWSYSWQGEKVEEFAGRYNTIFEAI